MKTCCKKKSRKPGFVLPAIFSVLTVIIFLALALTTRGTSSLRQATHINHSDQAYYAADAGLARAMAEYEATGDLKDETKGKVPSGATYEVSLYPNDGPGVLKVEGGTEIPPGTALMVCMGKSSSGNIRRRSAVLVQKGLGSVQVGSLAQNVKAQNSQFLAYNSDREDPAYSGLGVDPNSILDREAIIATNEGSGTPVELVDSAVKGSILVGPGGDKSQVSVSGTAETGQIGTLTEKIDLPPIEVPNLPGVDEVGAPPSPQYFKPTSHPDHVSFSQDADGKITIRNQCFSCVIQPDGSFAVSEANWEGTGSKSATGNINTGEVNHKTGGGYSNFDISITADKLSIGGGYHGMILDSAQGTITVDAPTNNNSAEWGHGSRETYTLPDWLGDSVFGDPPPDLLNPTELGTGYFGDVVINDGKTKLPDSTTVIVKNLTIENGGQLNLPKDGKDVTIYVTGSLTVKGTNAILNEARKAPELKVYYTGDKPVSLSGGAPSFMTLIAPDAPINLDGAGSTFFGALATEKDLNLKDAEFYYDVATDGVGVGTDGTTLVVLARQRF